MARVSEVFTWSAMGAELKGYLRVTDASEDVTLQLWWESALELADTYLGDPFTRDGQDLPIPSSIKLGLFELIRVMRGELGADGRPFGVTAVRTGDLSESYAAGAVGGVTTAERLLEHAAGYWFPWREDISI